MSEVDEDEPALRINVAPAENVLESRDPKKITANMLKTDFSDVIAEPDDVHSVDEVWIINHRTYTKSKACLYIGLSSAFGLPLSLTWALLFALLAFLNIWVIVPFIKLCLYIFRCAMHPVLSCMEYCLQSPIRILIGGVQMGKEFFRKAFS